MPDKPKLRVLLVDDIPDDTFVFGKVLEKLNCVVESCNDPTQCVAVAEKFDPHLIFLDYAMPRLSGPATARSLRAFTIATPYLLVARTGYTTDSVKQECFDAGFSHVLIKPVDVGQLTALLEEARAFAFGTD